MRINILSIMDTPLKKVGLAVLCGVIVASASVAAVAATGPHYLGIKVDNGVKRYSTDKGQTWSRTAPEGVTLNADGSISLMVGTSTEDAEGGMLSKMENGVSSYSTDGGKTWTEGVPDGVTVTRSEDGKITVYREAN
jgi:hypothetical protein